MDPGVGEAERLGNGALDHLRQAAATGGLVVTPGCPAAIFELPVLGLI